MLAKYECVRVESMAAIDFDRFRFDFDLTFAILLMEPDGRILATYAGRDHTDAESHLSLASLTAVLQETLERRAALGKQSARKSRPKTIESIPAYQRRRKGKQAPQCVHCHEVHDNLHYEAVDTKRWRLDQEWRWPDPRQLGWRLDRDEQRKVVEVLADSPAAALGMQSGDVITSVGGTSVTTFGDIQRVLHDLPDKPGRTVVAWTRGDQEFEKQLVRPRRWKEPTPLVFSWRASKWHIPPQPGFGGKPLRPREKKQLGIDEDKFAFRIGYLVTWGPRAHTGRNAATAGLRKGDVVLSLDGKDDFVDMHHYHAWFRLTRKPGTTVEVETIRDGVPRTVSLPVLK